MCPPPPCFGWGAIKNLHRHAVKQITRLQEGLVRWKTRVKIMPGEGWEGSRNPSPSALVSFPPECTCQRLGVLKKYRKMKLPLLSDIKISLVGEFAPPTDCHRLWLNSNAFSWIFISVWLCGNLSNNYGRNTGPKLQPWSDRNVWLWGQRWAKTWC